jgi:hypothetical protein
MTCFNIDDWAFLVIVASRSARGGSAGLAYRSKDD